jgi:outer membrane protein
MMLALAVPVAAFAQAARPITYVDAVKLAQQNSPTAVQARNAIDQNESAVRSAWGAFLPTLSVSQNASHTGGQTLFQGHLVDYSGPPWNFSRGITSSLTLFDAGQRNFQLSAARANVTSAEANERASRFSVALSVAQQYYAVLAARESRAAADAQLQQALEGMKAANARVAAGAATKSDSLRSVITVGNARLAILRAENDLQVANASLTRLVATPYTVTAVESDSLGAESFAVDSTELMRSANLAPTVLAAQAAVTAARASLKASRNPYFPRLSLNLGLNGSYPSSNFDWGTGQYSKSNSAGVSLSWTIFNGFQREDQIVRASIAEQNAAATYRDAKLVAEQQLISNLGTLRLADEQIAIQVASVDAAVEDLRVQQQRYSLGAATLLELVTSQSALNAARNSLISARRDARIAKANIESLLGREIK